MADVIAKHNLMFYGTGGKLLRVRQFTPVKYGLLYNGHAVKDARGIAPTGWHVPTYTDLTTLETTIGGSTQGYKLKETGLTYWNTPNSGATNEYGFNGRGTGLRISNTGAFTNIKEQLGIWSSTERGGGGYLNFRRLDYQTTEFYGSNLIMPKTQGMCIRYIKDDSTDPGTVTDYDGNIYPTVKIGNQVWMAANLIVTHYNNGDSIPEVTDGTTWIGLTTGALCAYNNDWDNV